MTRQAAERSSNTESRFGAFTRTASEPTDSERPLCCCVRPQADGFQTQLPKGAVQTSVLGRTSRGDLLDSKPTLVSSDSVMDPETHSKL